MGIVVCAKAESQRQVAVGSEVGTIHERGKSRRDSNTGLLENQEPLFQLRLMASRRGHQATVARFFLFFKGN